MVENAPVMTVLWLYLGKGTGFAHS